LETCFSTFLAQPWQCMDTFSATVWADQQAVFIMRDKN
jgi:hypothetical protein